MKSWNMIALSFAGCLSLGPIAWAADDNPMLSDEWRVYIGAFNASVDSNVGINGDVLPPVAPIDIEDTLGVGDSKSVPWGGISWHFARRHFVEFEFFSLDRTHTLSGTFTPPIQVGDLFIEDGQILTDYDTTISRLTYAYSLVRSDRSDLQLLAGLHIAHLDISLALSGAICVPTSTPSMPPGCPGASSSTDNEGVSAPLPHFGASFTYAISPSVAFGVSAKGFAIELDKIDGSLIEIDADIAWQPWRNVGFGLGARYFKSDVEAMGSELNGSFGLEYFGPTVYVQATF